ncbi:MAG: hypothetical protein CL878_07940 [Dehalococcoidia bacterium]|nr:hypothetical protein [Dehalococcoidia bacterium]
MSGERRSPPTAAAPPLTVVVCTYNRADLLANALQSLCQQTLSASDYEVIVVDNNCTDHTRSVVADYSAAAPSIRYCVETKQGLSHARNRGWQVARGTYVGYFDDDSKAPSHWLATGHRVVQKQAPDIFGGPYYPYYTSWRPPWFRHAYGGNSLDRQAGPLAEHEYLYGTNIFCRRDLLAELGGFDPQLGMAGTRIGYGEETALLMQARELHPDLRTYYDPRLYVFHLVPTRKMRLRWVAQEQFVGGRYAFRVFGQPGRNSVGEKIRLFRNLTRLGRELVRDSTLGCLQRDRVTYPFAQNYLYERVLKDELYRFGETYEELVRLFKQPV